MDLSYRIEAEAGISRRNRGAKKVIHESHSMTRVIILTVLLTVCSLADHPVKAQEIQTTTTTAATTTTERLQQGEFSSSKPSSPQSSLQSRKNATLAGIQTSANLDSSTSTLSSVQTAQRPSTSSSSPIAATSVPVPTSSALPTTTQSIGGKRATSPSRPKTSPQAHQRASPARERQQTPRAPRTGDGQTDSGGDPIDQQSTSQSLSFADPLSASTSNHEHQQSPPKSSNSNRWTHFGARLRPLASASGLTNRFSSPEDHQRADSKSTAAYARGANSQSSPQAAPAGPSAPLSNNQVSDEESDDDMDDDQDSEALLYKMMQQQGFLMGSMWSQQPQQQVSADQQRPLGGAQQANVSSGAGEGGDGQNSKRVIKLLKSYSHIHQVDDSDDQIRGTHTRLNVRQPASNNNGWQPSGGVQYYNKNRSSGRQQLQQTAAARHQPKHIFVSSQPLAQAYSNANARQQQADARGAYLADESADQDGAGNGGGDGQGPPEEDDFECPNNGIFADEASGCQSYHVCQSGAQVQQKFQCPMGTLFNNIILTCDFAHNVQCKGKEASPALRPAGLEDSNEPIYRQQAAQQVTQPSHGSQHPRQQQTPWSPQPQSQSQLQPVVQQQGPRHLKIGQSQYNQQAQQSGVGQAVSAYPHPRPPSNDLSDNNDDSDDEPVEPLIPATLPPRTLSASLPYNPPPNGAAASAPPQGHQSAHRSQYPTSQQGYLQQPEFRAQANGGYDGDSAASPVFVSRDEPRTTEASVSLVTSLYKQQQQASVSPATDAQSFNLVINHVAPTRQQPKSGGVTLATTNFKQRPATTDYTQSNGNSKKAAAGRQNAPSKQVTTQTQLPHKRAEAAKPQQQHPRYQQNYAVAPTLTRQVSGPVQANAVSAGRAETPGQRAAAEPQYSQLSAHYDNQRQSYQQATQPRAVHVGQQQSTTSVSRPLVVDLTNDKRAGVSSEAMNDGLLLIVRHSGSSPQQDRSNYKQQSAAAARGSASSAKQHTSGQAFALEPSAVQPNSPIDAQLFPNVQRVLASSQPAISHQAASTSQYVQHVPAQQALQPSQPPQAVRVSPPLAPMEPPKPVAYSANNENQQPQYNSERTVSSESLQLIASSATPSQSKKVSLQPDLKTPVKRSKRLRAQQMPQKRAQAQEVKAAETRAGTARQTSGKQPNQTPKESAQRTSSSHTGAPSKRQV